MIVTRSVKSLILIIVQLICILFLALSGKLLPDNILLRLVMALIGIIAVWAIIIMNKKFNIASEVISGAKLIRSGPYKIIRHPMYLSVFIITLCWIIDYFTYARLIVTLILYFAVILKINHEEKLLKSAFPEYEEYQSQSKKLIPFIY